MQIFQFNTLSVPLFLTYQSPFPKVSLTPFCDESNNIAKEEDSFSPFETVRELIQGR